jgi:hypothetical protein
LECGHRCAGVCGEICPSKDFCVDCAPEKVKSQGKLNYLLIKKLSIYKFIFIIHFFLKKKQYQI